MNLIVLWKTESREGRAAAMAALSGTEVAPPNI